MKKYYSTSLCLLSFRQSRWTDGVKTSSTFFFNRYGEKLVQTDFSIIDLSYKKVKSSAKYKLGLQKILLVMQVHTK